jgi:hypothetical protein
MVHIDFFFELYEVGVFDELTRGKTVELEVGLVE